LSTIGFINHLSENFLKALFYIIYLLDWRKNDRPTNLLPDFGIVPMIKAIAFL